MDGQRGAPGLLLAAILLLLSRGGARAQSDYGFDYLVLSRQWGPTFCESTSCTSSTYNLFTIHGLWPNSLSGSDPAFCDRSNTFADNDLTQAQLSQMACEWRSYKGPNENFWSYEWSKHGTCALDRFPTEGQYFGAALELSQQYDLNAALLQAGIDPLTAQGATRSQLLGALQGAWGVTPQLTCYKGAVSEVRLCFDPDLHAIDCPNGGGSCPSKGSIAFPHGGVVPASCEPYFAALSGSAGSSSSQEAPASGQQQASEPPPPTSAGLLQRARMRHAAQALLLAVPGMAAVLVLL